MSTRKTTKKATTGAKTAKTTSANEKRVKSVELEKSAPVAATVTAAKPAPVVEAKPERVMPKQEVEQLVREAAFLFAKQRNFRNGTPTQDWLAAEAFVNERLVARGFTVAR